MYLKDLLLTNAFLIKGHINTGGQRLSTFLNNFPRRFLEIEEVTVMDPVQDTHFTTTRMLVRVEEIILAHELEETGDESLRHLAGQDRDDTVANIQFSGTTPFQLWGKVSTRAIERDSSGQYDFIVVVEPKILGLTNKAQDVLKDLPYLIANKSRMALILE